MHFLWTGMSVVQKWAMLPVSVMVTVESRDTGGLTAGTVLVADSGLM